MAKSITYAVAAAALASAGSVAATENRYGYDRIAARDLVAAEARLKAQRIAEPDEPSVLINLAYVYRKTGRTEEAEALYERVLALPDALMALRGNRPAWSHMIARRGLGRATGIAITSPRP